LFFHVLYIFKQSSHIITLSYGLHDVYIGSSIHKPIYIAGAVVAVILW